MRWPTKSQSVSHVRLSPINPRVTYGPTVILNGEMTTTTYWLVFEDCTLESRLGGPSGLGRYIRATKIAGAHIPPWGMLNAGALDVGTPYRCTGYYRTDGSASARIITSDRITPTKTTVWNGIATTDWTYFEFEFTAADIYLVFGSPSATNGEYVEFDDVAADPIIYTPRALWHMKPSGIIIPDLSDNSNDGTIIGATQVNTSMGSALYFDGASSIDITGIASTNKSYTFSTWVKSSLAASPLDYLFDCGTDRLAVAFYGITAGKIGYYDGASWYEWGDAPNDGLWHHLVYLFDDDNSEASLYIDAEQLGTALTYSASIDIGGAAAIGSSRLLNANFFTGYIASLSIYDEVVSTAWITAEYERGLAAGWHTDW